jgi:lipoate-protein ligase A
VHWRCLVSEPGDGPHNMAVDETLLESVRAGGPPVLRLYRWSPACLSLGRNQAARGVYLPDRARALGIGIVRRPTGGLAVLHDRELTYAVAAPPGLFGGPRASYLRIHHALLCALESLGVQAALGTGRLPVGITEHARAAHSHPCFAEHARGEIVAHGRKLVGSAQRAARTGLLQHGSLLLDGDQTGVAALQRDEIVADDGAISLRELLGCAPPWEMVADAVVAGFEAETGLEFTRSQLSESERGRARTLEGRYRDDAWTWKT